MPPPRLRQRLRLHQPRDQPRPPRVPSPRSVVARRADGGEGFAGAAGDELERHAAGGREGRGLAGKRCVLRLCGGGGGRGRAAAAIGEQRLANLRMEAIVRNLSIAFFARYPYA